MIVGIDLGTTNSAVGIWRDGRSELIPNALGDLLTPSAVGIGDKGEVLVGMAARDRQSTHPQLTATAFKRWIDSVSSVSASCSFSGTVSPTRTVPSRWRFGTPSR